MAESITILLCKLETLSLYPSTRKASGMWSSHTCKDNTEAARDKSVTGACWFVA